MFTTLKKNICLLIAIFSIVYFNQCSKIIDGQYTLVKGDCNKSLILKNLGGGKFNIILQQDGVIEIEILGRLEGDKITGFAGVTPTYFTIKGDKLIFQRLERVCLYEKVK